MLKATEEKRCFPLWSECWTLHELLRQSSYVPVPLTFPPLSAYTVIGNLVVKKPKLTEPTRIVGLRLKSRDNNGDLNHDADAFIKPVSRVDVPDYYDIITNPMDFQTMGRKVKRKQYKSKKEFKDDLDLIWSNCFVYNATENHPLRLCTTRLKAKAEHLLKYITDRKERADPPVPVDPSGRRAPSHPPTRLNGINGHVHTLSFLASRPPSSNDTRSGRRLTPALTPPRRIPGQSFPDSPAIVRTADGMAAILELERSLDAVLSEPGPSNHAEALDALLCFYIGDSDSDADADGEADSDSEALAVDAATGDKRKLNGIIDIRILWQLCNIKEAEETPTKTRHTSPALAASDDECEYHHAAGVCDEPTLSDVDGSEDAEVVAVDEVPWPVPRPSRKALQDGFVDPSPDIGEMATEKCMQWVNRKILEHIGFQGSSQLALDVLTGITVEYLANVGRTFRFYLDRYSNTMTSEEIILHSLFESSVSRIQNLERYITDDIMRHGNRLNDLEKKIVNVYQEFTSAKAINDDTLFANKDDEEEESAFVMGQFTDDIGEDFLGLRELGMAAEFSLSSLSIPKRLLKGKKNAKGPNATTKSAEPPPPYPPPPPFVLLTAESVKNQVGLLRDFYERRLASTSASGVAPVVLQDDPPNSSQAKLGPLRQGLKQGSPFPPFSEYQDTFSNKLTPDMLAAFAVPLWILQPQQLLCFAKATYPYWKEHRIERGGHRIIPTLKECLSIKKTIIQQLTTDPTIYTPSSDGRLLGFLPYWTGVASTFRRDTIIIVPRPLVPETPFPGCSDAPAPAAIGTARRYWNATDNGAPISMHYLQRRQLPMAKPVPTPLFLPSTSLESRSRRPPTRYLTEVAAHCCAQGTFAQTLLACALCRYYHVGERFNKWDFATLYYCNPGFRLHCEGFGASRSSFLLVLNHIKMPSTRLTRRATKKTANGIPGTATSNDETSTPNNGNTVSPNKRPSTKQPGAEVKKGLDPLADNEEVDGHRGKARQGGVLAMATVAALITD
ncbi:hypothetical protein EDB86DRAFT_2838091 [Lactarius hatsudake]|nr:hypothetical protein EDB86DRAFT_2838091 [Lactarius hatsudake]